MLLRLAVLSLVCIHRGSCSRDFRKFQAEQLESTIPPLPLSLNVYGSIFQTAYYFVDIYLGVPNPQKVSTIIDTGSSTQGFPCNDCESCGRAHWDPYYNRSASDFAEKYACGRCTLCRLNLSEDTLQTLIPSLVPYMDNMTSFAEQTSALVLNNSDLMQCLYKVHYAEGSSLSGLFYKDVVWLNYPSQPAEHSCGGPGSTLGPPVPIQVPVGCHIEETHLFFDQKASGILGLEFWGSRGVPTFSTALLNGLQALYADENNKRVEGCENEHKFEYKFALCFSQEGGLMSFGGDNKIYHKSENHLTIPLLREIGKSQSYTVGITDVGIEQAAKNMTKGFKSLEILHPTDVLNANGTRTAIIPTLIDSGTTLTYLPQRVFRQALSIIEAEVARGIRDNNTNGTLRRRLDAADIFRASTEQLDFVPVDTGVAMSGPKRLKGLNHLMNLPTGRGLVTKLSMVLQKRPDLHRRLSESNWFAVFEPSVELEDEELLGFVDLPRAFQGAPARQLVQKVKGYGGGDCWWLPEKNNDLSLFPLMRLAFLGGAKVIWTPKNYLYTGSNAHFYCLALMTEESRTSSPDDEEIILGSNSFINHDVVFNLKGQSKAFVGDDEPLNHVLGASTDMHNRFSSHPFASITIIPAECPQNLISSRPDTS